MSAESSLQLIKSFIKIHSIFFDISIYSLSPPGSLKKSEKEIHKKSHDVALQLKFLELIVYFLLKVKFSKLKGINLDTKLVPNLIDELPAFFVAAAMSSGSTVVRNAEELRYKESDRLEAMGDVLRSFGVDFHMYHDGMDINGLDDNMDLSSYRGGIIESFGDHRIAMSSAIACSIFDQESVVLNTDNVNTSFPTFLEIADLVGLDISLEEDS